MSNRVARLRASSARSVLAAAALAAVSIALPRAAEAQQAIYPVVVDQTQDPLFANLTIPANAAQAGMWSGVVNWPIVAIHSALLPDGRVLNFGAAPGGTVQDGRTLVFWDPRLGLGTSAFRTLPDAQNVDSFCASATLLSNGNLLTSGGASYTSNYSSRESMVLDWKTSTPTRDYDLTAQRWYGTMTKLPDGRAIITGGAAPYTGTDPNKPAAATDVSSTPEVYTPGQGWRSLTGAYSTDAFGAANWRWWYPRQWVTPAGTLFGISTEKMWELKFDGNGSIRTVGTFKTTVDATALPNVGPTSTAVMYDTGKILQVGGNGYYNGYDSPSSAAATVFDITDIGNGKVGVTDTKPMAYPRQWASSVVLPVGQVLVVGGTRRADLAGANAVLAAESWNPATGAWMTGASAAVYRGYHSTATLLPDSAVLVAGGGIPGPATNSNAELYYPAYLFQKSGGASVLAARPRIVSLSTATGNYGQTVNVQTATGTDVAQVSLIAVASDTHSFDSNQRRLKLAFTKTDTGVTVTMPASANLAPPGYYQLSLVNAAGVPSAGSIVALAASAPGVYLATTTSSTATSATSTPSTTATQIGTSGSTIAAASDGTVVLTNAKNEIWIAQSGGGWTQLSGKAQNVAAIAANRYYAVGTDALVSRWNGTNWAVVGRSAARIAAASDGTVAVINNANGSVWVKTADDAVESWQQAPNVLAKRIAVLKRGSLYFVGTDNNLWRSDMANAPVRVGVNVVDVAASADGTITVVSTDGTLWRKTTDDTVERWQTIGGTAGDIATPDAKTLIFTDKSGTVFRR